MFKGMQALNNSVNSVALLKLVTLQAAQIYKAHCLIKRAYQLYLQLILLHPRFVIA